MKMNYKHKLSQNLYPFISVLSAVAIFPLPYAIHSAMKTSCQESEI